MSASAATQVTFPVRAWVAVAVVFGLMLALLAVQLTSIESQRHLVRDQDRKITALTNATLPLLREVRPLAQGAVASLPSLGRAIRAADPIDTLKSVKGVSDSLAEQDRLIRLVDAALGSLRLVADRHLLERADQALGDVPIALDALRRTVALQRDLLRLQRGTFELQSQSLAAQRDSLAVQRESLRHIESIDRKTGGTVGAR